MKRLVFLPFIVVVLLSACTIGGLTKAEKERINAGDSNDIMTLFVIDNPTDSVLLRQSARSIKPRHLKNKHILQLKNRMLATVNDPDDGGVGIAAPQLGVSIRMIYVQRFDKDGSPFEVYVNPKIEKFEGELMSGREGCLSVPGYTGFVNRSQSITLNYLDSLGNENTERIDSFTAVIFQHEIDHLNGKLYYDRIDGNFEALTITDN